jgi:hypothetical protein
MTPPELDAAFKLDIHTVNRTTLHRVYWQGQLPLKASVAGNNRYDCPPPGKGDQFGVLYLAFDLETCWMETVVRSNMVRPAGTNIQVPRSKMMDRWACEVSAAESLALVRFADSPMRRCAAHRPGRLRIKHHGRQLLADEGLVAVAARARPSRGRWHLLPFAIQDGPVLRCAVRESNRARRFAGFQRAQYQPGKLKRGAVHHASIFRSAQLSHGAR